MAYSIALEAWIIAHEAVKDRIFAGSDIAYIAVFDSANVKLTEATLDVLTSTVNVTTGDLTLAILDQDASADASGTASYARIICGDGLPIMELPCEEGTVSQSGKCVMNTLTVIQSGPTNVVSITIKAGALLV